jgi:predicted ferric reductase
MLLMVGKIASGLISISFFSLWLFRKWHYELFLVGHVLFALLALAGLIWHVTFLQEIWPRTGAYGAASLWACTSIFRLFRILYHGRAPVDVWKDKQVVRARVQLRRPLRLFPGCYFYLYFPNSPIRLCTRGHAMNAAFWSDTAGTMHSSELVFLMQKQDGINQLARSIKNFHNIYLDGPYGHDLGIQNYENVILAAKGIGIAAILPYALHLARRRLHDDTRRGQTDISQDVVSKDSLFRDTTRKVDIFWLLEDNTQQEWLRAELRILQKLDPNNVSLFNHG